MPAIRYRFSHTCPMVTSTSTGKYGLVELLMQGGKTYSCAWLGFICKAGTESMPLGSYEKMFALEVTAGDGSSTCDWIKLEEHQYVLCWRVLYKKHNEDAWGVYGIIGNNFCPLIVADLHTPPPSKKGRVLFLPQRDRKGANKIGNKIA